ncbi:hypothetical protein RT723_01670 [Psychrosphaera aquimarina]|uniref:RiboL-PSP-HEPN domain-containing protein n=1 Tax=Psychrosphaera aquimarina TaxID=2044854 RepID=A0ABU3QWF0_9GAMM|nr:hypothetical protein [Psychrosphaera aquimarina]MDU0111738.1 hypothetical protein [Psychrosphaera aquimarina]
MTDIKKHYIEPESLPELFPTHKHEPAFWEVLGRTVATFGFLEEILGKAIFALTATKPYSEEDIQAAYEAWYKKLEKALTDQLSYLTKSYDKSLREHPQSTITNIDELIEQLKEAAKIRNVICHGSWRTPDDSGASIPHFVNFEKMIFDTPIDKDFLLQVQKHVSDLICTVINTVTQMGFQFPGSSGPGKPI